MLVYQRVYLGLSRIQFIPYIYIYTSSMVSGVCFIFKIWVRGWWPSAGRYVLGDHSCWAWHRSHRSWLLMVNSSTSRKHVAFLSTNHLRLNIFTKTEPGQRKWILVTSAPAPGPPTHCCGAKKVHKIMWRPVPWDGHGVKLVTIHTMDRFRSSKIETTPSGYRCAHMYTARYIK